VICYEEKALTIPHTYQQHDIYHVIPIALS